jgi:hypothetical protein
MENPNLSNNNVAQEYLTKNAGYLVGMIFTLIISLIMSFLCYTQYKRTYPSPIVL